MMNNFQTWLNDSNYDFVRFYPLNTSEFSVSEMLESASNAVKSYDANIYFNDYTDKVSTEIDTPQYP